MNMKEYLTGNYIRKEDTDKVWEVYEFEETEMNDRKKLQVTLQNQDMQKLLTLNQTNLKVLIDLFGSDTSGLIGKKLVFKCVETLVNGEVKDSIIVDAEKTREKNGWNYNHQE